MAFTEEELLEFRTRRFIKRFSEWKRVLKGEALWKHPVRIAPEYLSGLFKLPEPTHIPDWEKESPWLMMVNRFLVSMGWGTPIPKVDPLFGSFESPNPPEAKPIDPVELQIQFPELPTITRGQWEKLFKNISECQQLSFELVARNSKVVVQFVCDETERLLVRRCIAEVFPGVIIREEREYLATPFLGIKDAAVQIHEYGLANDCAFPLKTWQPHEDDPLTPIVDMLLSLRSEECGVFQVSFAAADRWRNDLAGLCLKDDPVPFTRAFGNKAERGPAKQKITRPFVGAVVRVGLRTSTSERAEEIFRALDACFRLEQPGSNSLHRLPNNGYPASEYDTIEHLLHAGKRQSCRTGMLLSHDELFSLVHLPLARAGDTRLRLVQQRTKAPRLERISTEVENGGVFGYNEHGEYTREIVLTPEQRSRHTYIIGVSGTGKSTLLFGLVLADMLAGRGCAVIDPHGDLIEKLLEYVPENRLNDVVLFDPSDEEYPIGFNILVAHSDAEKNLLANDLVAVFRRLSTSWGDQMNTVFVNAILAFLESSRGGTLVDLRNFLVDKEYRLKFLETVKDEGVRYYWTKEFPMLTGKPQGPILTRLDAFLRPKMIRNMVSQKENKLDFSALINRKKIVFAKLAHGAIGPEDSYLLGSLLVAKFQQAAFSRQNLPQSERSLFNLYIDEFHDFITPSIASILSGGRKFGLGLTLAHQELRQLWSRDEQVASAVLAGPATRVCFRTGDWDAQKLAEGFSFFKAKDIQNLGKGEAICRVDTAENDFNLKTIPWELIVPGEDDGERKAWKERIRASSREQYAGSRHETTEVVRPEPPAPPLPEHVPPPLPEIPRIKRDVAIASEPLSAAADTPKSPRPEPTPGRGGQKHKYFQHLFKQCAEEKGYRAEIEKAILDGAGSVDLALEKNGKTIAVEISITTSPAWELGNIEKCLAAKYEKIFLISPERMTLQKLRALAEAKWKEELTRIFFMAPEDFLMLLEQEEADTAGSEDTVRGYKVKRNFRALDGDEKEARKQNISQTILKALKRLKGV